MAARRCSLLAASPLRSASSLPSQRRHFFGLGEIVGVLANPGETIKQLADSKKLLQEARQELKDDQERKQIPPKHTFSALPGFWPRDKECHSLRRALTGVPSFTVLFGSSSVGKTALLRELLSNGDYHVLFFDLRIAGFADLESLYFSMSIQIEQFFLTLKDDDKRFASFEKESFAFKYHRREIEKRLETPEAKVKTADVAHLMELFQSSLLKYWHFTEADAKEEQEDNSKDTKSEKLKRGLEPKEDTMKARTVQKEALNTKSNGTVKVNPNAGTLGHSGEQDDPAVEEEPPLKKKIPVFLLDEAHKLPALIKSNDTMKSLLDAILVLTKQDRLIHVIHATSDSFYLHWLRQLNILQHCLMLTIGDPSYTEAKAFYEERLVPDIPKPLQAGIDFEKVYDVFGGKLTHLADYVTDYINSDGKLPLKESSHFLQAYALVNLQLVHAAAFEGDDTESEGFKIYSSVPTTSDASARFTPEDLLKVMRMLQDTKIWELSYFQMCRDFGTLKIDAMVRGRLLELRWTPSLTIEGRRTERPMFDGR